MPLDPSYRCPRCGADRANKPRDLPCDNCELTYAEALEATRSHLPSFPTDRRTRFGQAQLRRSLDVYASLVRRADEMDLSADDLKVLQELSLKHQRLVPSVLVTVQTANTHPFIKGHVFGLLSTELKEHGVSHAKLVEAIEAARSAPTSA